MPPQNRVRFAWWSGEDDGLVGSDHYVAQLSKTDLKYHALNLNFDMVASPNPVRFVSFTTATASRWVLRAPGAH
ncbi:M28 family peptidase [Arthrobacter sp. Soil762]|uniref:M28 family peptidase n=1 Tax=Arthrobacter sp. Soil762 TaxID=1736401 RepID=UPI0006F990E8|nr:M28 family peptidase [Arthrobacter sp. Soil762]KRE70204.1 hypothetical protein ASG77_15345 [Arthrobacter sp. Soil762]